MCAVEKAKYQGLVCHFEVIFVLLTFPKCDLVEVQKAMFQGLAWQFQLIFGLCSSQKCDLGEEKMNLLVVARHS